jgi:dihydropteroate synthase
MLLHCGKFKLDLSQPKVMGIVNVTPDSFSDGGKHLSLQAAIAHAYQLIEEGADILDIGGESTRPGAAQVSEQEELDRVLPVIEALRAVQLPVSIDTYKPAVMRAALAAGATMVNDINALQDPEALVLLATSDAGVCLMHKQGTPQTMQQAPHYVDVIDEVMNFLNLRVQACVEVGISLERLVIDPGFGFGKTTMHNFEILRNLNIFKSLNVNVLAGLSRKSMLGQVTGRDIEHRQAASVAAALIAVQRGAHIVRVHDVRETVDALKVWRTVADIATSK